VIVQYDEDEGMALVTEVKEDGMYTLHTADGFMSAHKTDLKVCGGQMEFHVERMHVQGGGTLIMDSPKVGSRLSFGWLEPVDEDWQETSLVPRTPLVKQ
jgi:hypothetical protein